MVDLTILPALSSFFLEPLYLNLLPSVQTICVFCTYNSDPQITLRTSDSAYTRYFSVALVCYLLLGPHKYIFTDNLNYFHR